MQAIEVLGRYKASEYIRAYVAIGAVFGAVVGVVKGFKLVSSQEDSTLDAIERGQLFYASFIASWGAVIGGVSGITMAFFSPVIIPALIIRRFGKRKN